VGFWAFEELFYKNKWNNYGLDNAGLIKRVGIVSRGYCITQVVCEIPVSPIWVLPNA